ncbi:unnamed protein product, partial [Rotaria sp. Silwood1]
ISDNLEEDKETIEKNHTHCILFDGGQLNTYLDDSHRHKLVTHACAQQDHTCHAVTLIIEGGVKTLEVIRNDIDAQRPIVLIQGSGRLADMLAKLIKQTSNFEQNQLRDLNDKINQAIDQFFPNLNYSDISEIWPKIRYILARDHRHLLNVFSLDRDNTAAETIFKAIFNVQMKKNKTENSSNTENPEQRRRDEDILVDLAIEWNYLDGVLPILQSRKDLQMEKTQELITEDMKREKELFKKCLKKNRPAFIQYFLMSGFDPLTLINNKDISSYQTVILDFYKYSHCHMTESHADRVETLFGESFKITLETLDEKLNKFVGAFIEPIYSATNHDCIRRVCIDMKLHLCGNCRSEKHDFKRHDCKQQDDETKPVGDHNNQVENNVSKYTKDKFLRDLFLWSIFMDMPEMAKIFLVHLPSRICAALIASAIFKRYSKASTSTYMKEKFQNQSLEFEENAVRFIDKCYEYNERLACELLLRKVPLFGNVTCMQVAISSECGKLVGTHCFDQAVNQVWCNKLSITNQQTSAKPSLLFSILSFGLLAPIFVNYRKDKTRTEDELLSSEGINYYTDIKSTKIESFTEYWSKFKYFHQSPMIKMCYHFISYIWFLLVFSYMMLYHLDSPSTFTIPHWTEIYVIITIFTMSCEEVRKLCHEYKKRMIERWGSTRSSLLTVLIHMFYFTPYILFYLGLEFRYVHNDNILTITRIIWAFDLELWYLRSLKFVIALKSIGPKLFMLKNMFRALVGFVYMIFIAIAAYGVVSRALICYKQVPFIFTDIVKEIFYEPYWFIYGEFSDKKLLDDKANNDTSSVVTEATATQFLLAFHMLFINILILNLLIAVFTHTIDQVQENTEFYWRYQHYAFVREYFERPLLAYPSLIIIPHIIIVCRALLHRCCPKLCQNRVYEKNHQSKLMHMTYVFTQIDYGKGILGFENGWFM